LKFADLSGATLAGAKLKLTDLSGVDLSKAIGLTQEQIESAVGDQGTKLPLGLHIPETWKN